MAVQETLVAIKNTAPKYMQGVTDQTVRRRFILKYLQEQGRILLNQGSPRHYWNVKAFEPTVVNKGVGQKTTFSMTDVNLQLDIGHVQMEATNSLDRRTVQINRSAQQIVDLTQSMMNDLTDTLTKQMNDALYGDNSADETLLTGIRSLMQPHASVAATDIIAVPSATATYGNQRIGLGAKGGRWSSSLTTHPSSVTANDWPDGQGDPQYDYLAPKMWQYTGQWQEGSNDWASNGERVLRRSRVAMEALAGEGMVPSLHMLARDLYVSFLDNLVNRERLQVSDYAKSLGFNGVIEFEGAIIQTDFACPAGRGYGINPLEMALYSVNEQLFFVDGPEWNMAEQAYLFLVGFLGNVRYNPKHFCEYAQYV